MKIVEVPKFRADDGSMHDTLDGCAKREVELMLFELMGISNTEHQKAAFCRSLAEDWQKLHGRLLYINNERVRIANEIGE